MVNGGVVPVSFTTFGWLGADSGQWRAGSRYLASDNVTGVAGLALPESWRHKRTTTLHRAANLEREEKGDEEEENLTMETRPLYNLEEIRSCNETTARPADFEIMDVSVCT